MAAQNIVVVGASFAGLGVAHYLLRHTIPKLEASNAGTTYKLILVSTTDQFFYKIASPRTIASPEKVPVSKLFIPIADGFKDYPADHFELVIGTATVVEEDNKIVTVKKKDGATYEVQYNAIVCASGSTYTSALWTLKDDPQESKDEFERFHNMLPDAKSILISGGGPAGVETAGELAAAYPDKKITILSGQERLLHRLVPKVGRDAESYLNGMKVTTEHRIRVTKTTPSGSQTVVELDNGTSPTVDVYIDATGGSRNATWIPQAWLTDNKNDPRVLVDEKTLRSPIPGVYAIGDIASYSQCAVLDVNFAVAPLCSSILEDLSPAPKPAQKPFKQIKAHTQLVPIGPSGGVGILFGWRIPSFFVWLIKGRTYFVEKSQGTVAGDAYLKA